MLYVALTIFGIVFALAVTLLAIDAYQAFEAMPKDDL